MCKTWSWKWFQICLYIVSHGKKLILGLSCNIPFTLSRINCIKGSDICSCWQRMIHTFLEKLQCYVIMKTICQNFKKVQEIYQNLSVLYKMIYWTKERYAEHINQFWTTVNFKVINFQVENVSTTERFLFPNLRWNTETKIINRKIVLLAKLNLISQNNCVVDKVKNSRLTHNHYQYYNLLATIGKKYEDFWGLEQKFSSIELLKFIPLPLLTLQSHIQQY